MVRAMGGNVAVVQSQFGPFVRYVPTASRSTLSAILAPSSYSDGQRVITDANGRPQIIGGYRPLTDSRGNVCFRQLVDLDGKNIEGAVFPLDKQTMPMSNLGIPVRVNTSPVGVSTVAVSDAHAEGYRMAQAMFEFPNADTLVNNGDIVDRGPAWFRIYMALSGIQKLLSNWGNHDAMWFGAGVGNKALVAELFRWLFRYNEQGLFAKTFGINFDMLEAYAREHYLDAAGSYKAKVKKDGVELGKAMEAVLTAIKLKLEAQDRYAAPAEPISASEQRVLNALRHTSAVAQLLPEEKALFDRLTAKQIFGLTKDEKAELKNLNSELASSGQLESTKAERLLVLEAREKEGKTLLALVDRLKAADRALDAEEQAIVDDLTEQLLGSAGFREMTLWFIEKGGMYSVVDGNLYFHSHYPVDKNGALVAIDGLVGKPAFDAITARVKKVGEALRLFHNSGGKDRTALDAVQADVNWMRFLAWDYQSPLYGRVMQTWERAYLQEASGTYEEPEDPFYGFMEPKRPRPVDAKVAKDAKKLKAWEEGEGREKMEKYYKALAVGEQVREQILLAWGLDPKRSSIIKGHKPEKGEGIGRPIVQFNGGYLNIDGVMSGPAADVATGYGILLVTTETGQLIEISMAPQRRTLVKDPANLSEAN